MRLPLLLLLVAVCKASCLGAQAVEASQNRVITVESYDAFLNEVNTLLPEANNSLFPLSDLYEEKMVTSWNSVSIIRSGAPGNEHYEMTSAEREVPVCFISWNDAACYANWCNQQSSSLFFNAISSDKKATDVDHDLKSNQLFFCLIEVHAYAYEASGEGAAVDTFLGIEEIGALIATLSGLGANRPVAIREERLSSQRELDQTFHGDPASPSQRSINMALSANIGLDSASGSIIEDSQRPADSSVLPHQPSTTMPSMLARIWPKNNFLNRRGLLSKKQGMDARFMESTSAVSKNLEKTTVPLKKNNKLALTSPMQEIKSSDDFFEIRALTRTSHSNPAAACGSLVDTASVSHCSSGGMKDTAVVAMHRLPCLHQAAQRLATNHHEMFGLGKPSHALKKKSPRNASVTFAELPASLLTESTSDSSTTPTPSNDDRLEQEITSRSSVEERGEIFGLTPVPFQEELTAVTLQFARIQNRVKKALKALTKNDPQKSTKAAAIYASIYPETRRFLQNKLAWIQSHPLLQNEFAARFLATATIKLINIASKTVASEAVVPIQKEYFFCCQQTHPFNLPFELVLAKTMAEKRRGEKLNIPLRDLDDGMIVDMAKDAVDNLQELIDTFKKPFQEIGVHFHQCRIKRAERTKGIAVQKVCKIGEKNCLTDEEKADLNFSHRSSLELRKLKEATSVLDATEAKREIVTTIIQLVHSGLDAADCLVEMLARRKKVFKSPCQLSSR